MALYDTSLSEMTPDVLYSAACEEKAKSVLLIKPKQGTTSNYDVGNFDVALLDPCMLDVVFVLFSRNIIEVLVFILC